MFAVATGKQKTFAIGVYNKEVRALVKENMRHIDFADEWADVHYQNVVAPSQDEAVSIIKARYSEDQGFVISSVKERKTSLFE